jgi:hypothetical protein
MQEGRAGNWLFYLAYTPEPHQGAFFFSYYLLLGKLSGISGIEPLLLLHLSRVLTIPFGLLSFYSFAAYFTTRIIIRRLAFLLFGLTAGLGWLWLLLGLPAELGVMPVDLWVPDASFFLSAFTFSHLPLAQGLLLWLVMSSLTFLESGSWGWWGVAAGTSLLVSFIHPYTLPIVILLLGIYLLWQTRRQVWSFWQGVGRLILIAAPAGPYLIYVLFVFETNFAFKAWRDQSLTSSPNPLHYVLGFGLLLPLVGLGLWQSQRTPMKHSAFLIIWVVVIPLLLYFPIPLQRRFLDGYQAPLAVFGAIGLGWLVDHLNTKVRRLLITVMILTLMTLTNLFLLLGGMTVISRQNSPVFHPGYQQTAFKWFDDNAQGQVVLTAYETGNILPAYAPVRVFVGHGPETIDSNEKRRLVTQLFTESTPNAWRQALLQEYGIHYLYYGPYERLLGDFSPSDASYLQQVYDNGTVQVYQVVKVKTEN